MSWEQFVHHRMPIFFMDHFEIKYISLFLKVLSILRLSATPPPLPLLPRLNFLSEIFIANLVSLTYPSLHILEKTQTGVPDFQISGEFFINKNCHNSRTSHDVDIKLGQ